MNKIKKLLTITPQLKQINEIYGKTGYSYTGNTNTLNYQIEYI